jgi:hypothetical protein
MIVIFEAQCHLLKIAIGIIRARSINKNCNDLVSSVFPYYGFVPIVNLPGNHQDSSQRYKGS